MLGITQLKLHTNKVHINILYIYMVNMLIKRNKTCTTTHHFPIENILQVSCIKPEAIILNI